MVSGFKTNRAVFVQKIRRPGGNDRLIDRIASSLTLGYDTGVSVDQKYLWKYMVPKCLDQLLLVAWNLYSFLLMTGYKQVNAIIDSSERRSWDSNHIRI